MSAPKWLPNAISGVRIAMVPIWLWTAHQFRDSVLANAPDPDLRTACVLLLVALGVSDVLDGWIARRFELTSNLGALLDACADKLAQVAIYTYLAIFAAPAFTAVPLWFIGVLILRDAWLAVGVIAIKIRRGQVDMIHLWHGKLCSVLLFVLMLWLASGTFEAGLPYAFGVIAILVAFSTGHYVRIGWAQFVEHARGLDHPQPS